ncbi:hypothetical protein H2203_000219 [Taxawa tesnikishii (nom. ined.)]|nr:hypothetical protein H2203_000219 [Dothideales sp. JES 119]
MYDARSKNYDDSWHPSFALHFVSLAQIQPGENVPDLARGIGLVTFANAQATGPSGSVVGVEISTGMLEQALAEKFTSRVTNAELYRHDVARLDTHMLL